MNIFISNLFVGNTPLWFPFKETFNDILISSVVFPIHPAKVCIYRNLHYVALELVLLSIYIYIYHQSALRRLFRLCEGAAG